MTNCIFSQIARGAGLWVLLCLCGPAAAKMPEAGGPKQFDLFCQGRDEVVLRYYIPVIMAGPEREIPKIEKVKKHLIVDMDAMKFLVIDSRWPTKEFRKIAPADDGLLHLYDWRGFDRWVINLTSYKSVLVEEADDGSLSIEKMQCRPDRFSGFSAAPKGPPLPALVSKQR